MNYVINFIECVPNVYWFYTKDGTWSDDIKRAKAFKKLEANQFVRDCHSRGLKHTWAVSKRSIDNEKSMDLSSI